MTLFIAEQSQIVRASIINLVSDLEGVEVVGSGRSVSALLSGVSRLRPDVILLDVQLCSNCSVDLPRLMKVARPALQVIVLANHPRAQLGEDTQRAVEGADDFVNKVVELDRLTEILRRFTPVA